MGRQGGRKQAPRGRGSLASASRLSQGSVTRGHRLQDSWGSVGPVQRALTDPQVQVVQEEAAQHLIQRPVHLQPSGSTHQPLQQMLELLGHML